MINPTFRAPLLLLSASMLSACGPQSDSLGSLVTVSLDEKPIATLNVSLKCEYVWDYFSERDMASHYRANPKPAKAPNVLVTLPDSRMLALAPKPWPPLDENERCNLLRLQGWQALVLDPRKPVPLLTLVSPSDETAGDLAGLAIHPSRSNDDKAASPSPKTPQAFQQAIAKASSLNFAVLEIPADGEASTSLSTAIVSALRSLPTERPSVLLPAKQSNTPLNLDSINDGDTLAGLPGFHATMAMGENPYSTYPSAPGLPISVNPSSPGPHLKAYFPSDVPTPSVSLPDLDNPVTIAPAAAVWYPTTRRLVVFTWTQRSAELAKLLN